MMQTQATERSPIAQQPYNAFGRSKREFLSETTSQAERKIQHCAVVDLTNLSRVGFRGMDSAAYLHRFGFSLPEHPNHALAQVDGSWIARLSMTEYLVLGSLDDFGERIAQLENDWQPDEQYANHLLPRQDSHAWIQLTGQFNTEIMAKLCAVDLSTEAFPVGKVAQTSVARVNAIVINVGDLQTQKLNILCDRAAALYLWQVLQDAISEFSGEISGIEGLI
ncbi:sarcosine oxidase subunit gamma [Acinetobacter sp. ANC 3791]|uniref:sarcosine oxidase subunit gamma n=1 Tax=Acinetobacter sp. ANC 3791 TaxID=2529836 RepID=UPI001038E311|nr:sarcosine oxidase subunit gamma family protein [Acinetobacter sp. ANC 3791]TCB85690.1 sarcosine oxidase [Acinetobacter sp. ANC 3791]